MFMKKAPLQLTVALILSLQLTAQNTPLWLRYPAISPDGKMIVFSYKGDLYKVASNGGEAVPLTIQYVTAMSSNDGLLSATVKTASFAS